MSQLKLAYAPLTAYEFAIAKEDKIIEQALENASLYIIAQRPVITFENISQSDTDHHLQFEIHQKSNDNILKCIFPLYQKAFNLEESDGIYIKLNHLNEKTKQVAPENSNAHGFSLCKQENHRFINWFSPEKLLQNWWKGMVECEIEGDWKSFLQYKVHYVGKATKQNIVKRLTGHSKLQDILTLETPVTENQLPANEIVILTFEFQDNIQILNLGQKADKEDIAAAIRGEHYPSQEKVFLDAEKALVRAMQPEYNKVLFENYPISKDGLYNDNYNAVSYTLTDPIVLKYKNGIIRGGLSDIGGDAIIILDNKEFKLIKHE